MEPIKFNELNFQINHRIRRKAIDVPAGLAIVTVCPIALQGQFADQDVFLSCVASGAPATHSVVLRTLVESTSRSGATIDYL